MRQKGERSHNWTDTAANSRANAFSLLRIGSEYEDRILIHLHHIRDPKIRSLFSTQTAKIAYRHHHLFSIQQPTSKIRPGQITLSLLAKA